MTTFTAATLTRIRLNHRSPTVRRDLADAVQLHKTLMRLAADGLGPNPRQQAGLLFRLDDDPHPTLLVQTSHPPHLDRLPPGYGTAETRNLTPMLGALTVGLLVHYRITANASTRLPDRAPGAGPERRTRDTRGKVIKLTGERALTWWHHRATRAGLAVHTTAAAPRPFRVAREQPGPRHPLTRFDGIAEILDPDALTRALLDGIGRGKAYGAGLLSLAPA
ncbi:type I-E CRISPR-associated protein Cas6/Cse3/CasE [Streptomyces sp. MI02-7b]|uniref:type I-E CRISPR-associated protein Cas6/Cse3/CasE n=1 Tax=Streptomyces sp. MI02-7b TaxID=462941 RepID=UPI0029BF8B82|nr:type I-E CRISPR-associated protein Cas6/Cse3/CasE [Streptomyces sp. MI02-7b]MDX3077863.1 type I-E CRISPR-associated protein Cas6/Cse3/CasE [Streptomyces sp. MI02-7b]